MVWLSMHVFITPKAATLGYSVPFSYSKNSYSKNNYPLLKQSYLKTKKHNK